MANPAATREEVNQTAASAGMVLSTAGLDQRFNGRRVCFLDSLLTAAVQQLVSTTAPAASLLTRFNGVYVGDSTRIELPKALAGGFSRDREQASAAAKVAVQWELGSGGLRLWLSDGTVQDQRSGIGAQPLPTGALRLNDLGFFNLERFAQDSAEGISFFSRYKVGTQVYTAEGKPLDLGRVLRRQHGQGWTLSIRLGASQLPCRLIALPVSPEQVGKRRQRLRRTARRKQQPLSQRCLDLAAWTLYVTHVPPEQLTLEEAPILGATRGQIELWFKRWKRSGWLAQSRSQDPQRVWCEIDAKLLALLLQHWVLLVGGWHRLERSLHRAIQVLRKYAFCLLNVLTDLGQLRLTLHHLAQVLAHTCRLSKRKAFPLTFQRWLEVAHA